MNEALKARYDVKNLIALDRKSITTVEKSTCFQSILVIRSTDIIDQRDYILYVENDKGVAERVVKLRVIITIY